MKEIEYGDYDPNNGDYPSKGDALYCNKKKHFVYPPYVKNPYFEDDDPDVNWPMPKKCTDKQNYSE